MASEQWSVLEMVLGTRLLADVCGPFDDGHADDRLAYLSQLLTRLRRRFDSAGVREWFGASSPATGGATPRQVLSGAWLPDDPGPRRLLDSVPPARHAAP